MHSPDVLILPDAENGLPMIRWKVLGFHELRRQALLSHKCEFELIEGLILHRESWSAAHDPVVAELADRLREADIGEVRTDEELSLDDLDSVVSPDIAVGDGLPLPNLVVEVTHSAPRVELHEKQKLYARAGIEHYWHVDLADRVWRTHSLPDRCGYRSRASGPAYRETHTMLDGFADCSLDEVLAAAFPAV